MKKSTTKFQRIVVDHLPLIDVRAPIEFKAGAFQGAVNLPILNDEERAQVGTCYKKKGQNEAIKLGHELVKGLTREKRVDAWCSFLSKHPETFIYCFRGGLRSQLAQQWIKEEIGESCQRLGGGYKAFRNYLIEQLDPIHIPSIPLIVGGRTGVGKTIMLSHLDNFIDLEAIANHRGSAFGRFITPQPTLIDFENRLSYEIIRHVHQGPNYLVFEDEGRHIGRCYLPPKLLKYLDGGDLILLEVPLEQRIHTIFNEYVVDSQLSYSETYGPDDGPTRWLLSMNQGVERIQKRLGGERTQKVKKLLQSAFESQQRTEAFESHKRWIEILLCEYYDKMYDYQLRKNNRSIIFKGSASEAKDFLLSMG